MDTMTTKTETGTDPATEERIEEMLEIEHDLREQYEDAQINTDDPEEDDAPADSRLDEYTGRVIDFEREELSEYVKQTRAGSKIRLTILRHDGTKLTTPIQWPFDPTDKEEPLVRLCEYVDVPIDRVAELQGEYVPMEKNFGGHSHLEIPPIPTRGNRLAYRVRRFLRTHPTLRTSLVRGGRVAGTWAWIPAAYLMVWIAQTYPETAPTSIIVAFIISLLVLITSALICVFTAIPWLSKQRDRFFPKA